MKYNTNYHWQNLNQENKAWMTVGSVSTISEKRFCYDTTASMPVIVQFHPSNFSHQAQPITSWGKLIVSIKDPKTQQVYYLSFNESTGTIGITMDPSKSTSFMIFAGELGRIIREQDAFYLTYNDPKQSAPYVLSMKSSGSSSTIQCAMASTQYTQNIYWRVQPIGSTHPSTHPISLPSPSPSSGGFKINKTMIGVFVGVLVLLILVGLVLTRKPTNQ